MNRLLEPYLDPVFEYKFTQGPHVVQSREDAIRYGINCVSLAHLALKDLFEYELPSELQCTELYMDRDHFDKVENIEDMQTGDLLWFGLQEPLVEAHEFVPHYVSGQLLNWDDFPIKHVAIYTGETDMDNEYLLLHSTHVEGTNVVWPLSKFREYHKYRKLYGISRLKTATNKQSFFLKS